MSPAMEDRIREIHDALADRYGVPEPRDHLEPLPHLVRTILSQNTTDENRDAGYRGLLEAFGGATGDVEPGRDAPDWEAVAAADVDEVADAIRPAGLANQKASRIQGALEAVQAQGGDWSMGFVEEMDADEALEWMTGIKGVGPKTASVVLLFDFDLPLFPVDTHCHRLGKRFGLLPEGASRSQAHDILREAVPDELKHPFHLLLIRHGREVCTARNSGCADDPVCQRFCENAKRS